MRRDLGIEICNDTFGMERRSASRREKPLSWLS